MSGYQDVPMTRRRAQLLEEYASKLADMLEAAPNDKDLAEWVQSKIDRAAAAIQSAYHYLDQDDESDLEKAVGHKYTHRKRVGTDKKGRARYRYYYAEHQGGGISRAKFEAGSAFKLTWKGRRGHFHIDRVEGNQIFITHDSRPDMEPVPVQADELRALLTKQHSKAEQKHVKRRQREVEEIKRRAHRGGLGLALHRLRQAAAQAGVSLPEQYQRKPKKTRAKVAETTREVETPEKGEPVQDERFEYGLELEALAKRAGLKYSEQGVTRSVDARVVRDNEPRVLISAMHLQKVYPKLTQQQVNDFKARAIAYLKEFTGDDLTEDIQHTAQSNQTRSRMIYKELDAAISHIINEVGRGGREERKATLQAVKMLAEWRESIQQPTTPREQLTETAREVTQGADNFETMPEVESARATTATVRDVQSTLKASRRADKLTATGRRARASINADRELIEAVQRALDEGYKGMESPAFIPLNERTPRQANYQRLKGALNGFKGSQTLTRGSWTDDHKSLQKKRIKARDQLDEALKELDQIARSQEQAQVRIEDLPPKGQRTAEDAKRFFGEPKYFERIEGSKTKRYVIYERDGHRIVGPASGRGKGKFSRSFSWDTPRYRREREQGNIIAGPDSLTYQEIADYDTLDEALTRTVNQYRSQDEMIDKLIEKEKERLTQGRKELERLNATPREQLTETAREVTQGADNFETMPEVESLANKKTTRERSLALRGYKPEELIEIAAHAAIQDKAVNKEVDAKARELEREYKDLANTAARLGSEEELAKEGGNYRYQDAEQAAREKHEERLNLARIDIYNKVYRDVISHLRGQKRDYVKQRNAIESRIKELNLSADSFETPQPTAPARQALTETTERVTSDQTAEQATTRATPRPSEATLRGSGELDETVRANLQDRAQFLLSTPENVTKTGMRSKAQRAKDSELLLIYMRLQSDAQARLGPTAPQFNERHTRLMRAPRDIGINTALMTPYRAELREGIKDAIRELEQATSGQVTKSAHPLITYRAQLIQTVERLTAA
jgi:hypothetical protein